MAKARRVVVTAVILACICSTMTFGCAAKSGRIHCVTDISHEFTFYFDGRFGRNYVGQNGVDVRNWGTLHKYDFGNINLLVLQSGASPCAYLREDIKAIRKFLQQGGGVIILGDHARFRQEKSYRLNALVKVFGAKFVDERAEKPLTGSSILEKEKIESYSPKVINLEKRSDWEILVKDAKGRTIMARRRIGKGQLIVTSRALSGHKPDASDPINQNWLKPLLKEISGGKPVGERRRPSHQMPEN